MLIFVPKMFAPLVRLAFQMFIQLYYADQKTSVMTQRAAAENFELLHTQKHISYRKSIETQAKS